MSLWHSAHTSEETYPASDPAISKDLAGFVVPDVVRRGREINMYAAPSTPTKPRISNHRRSILEPCPKQHSRTTQISFHSPCTLP